ncbi:DUF1190 domain-containing protein [Pluralibacter gergoviae]|uniref:DUF1190 domain-containing protein n=1 Tax=Pluralibacter gergoviae TaxID=61647 RepID=UPI003EE19FDD
MARKRKSGRPGRRKREAMRAPLHQPSLLHDQQQREKRQRYARRGLTLALMGGAALIGLHAGEDANNDGVYYASIDECAADNNSYSVCADAWANAREVFEAGLPPQLSRPACEQLYSLCSWDSGLNGWAPFMSGFLLSRAPREKEDEQTSYHSGGGYYSSRPVWRTASGDYVRNSGREVRTGDYSARRVAAVNRGGFGSHGRGGG